MDSIFLLHLLFIIFFLSIPFWKIKYLRYGVYAPIILATIWIIFDGCPLTHIQKDLNDEYFSQVLLKLFYPEISKETTVRFTYYILLLVTIIGFIRLCPEQNLRRI
jgi:uncharacterized membrane protein YkvI